MKVEFNTVTANAVSVVNGANLETASNLQIIYQTPATLWFDATLGETIYFHVEGTSNSVTAAISITASLVVTRITEYPVEVTEEKE